MSSENLVREVFSDLLRLSIVFWLVRVILLIVINDKKYQNKA